MKSVSLAPSSGIHTNSHSSNVLDDYGIDKKANNVIKLTYYTKMHFFESCKYLLSIYYVLSLALKHS